MNKHQIADSGSRADIKQGVADAAPEGARRELNLDVCEEISEDAYKQNHVYRPGNYMPPRKGRAA